jgi:hypothetical protein
VNFKDHTWKKIALKLGEKAEIVVEKGPDDPFIVRFLSHVPRKMTSQLKDIPDFESELRTCYLWQIVLEDLHTILAFLRNYFAVVTELAEKMVKEKSDKAAEAVAKFDIRYLLIFFLH